MGYALTINSGGISTSPLPVVNLFKSVASLVYYARISGTGPRLRQGSIRTPTAGVENKRTIGLHVPTSAAAGGGVTFEAQFVGTGISTPLLPVIPYAPFKTTHTGRLAFGGCVPTDFGTPAVYAVRLRGGPQVLLRILTLRASTNGGGRRILFEYRSL